MAVVLVWRPWGLFGRPQAPSRDGGDRGAAAAAAGARGVAPAGSALAALALLPLLGADAVHDRADDRPADRGAVRRQPALHHGPGGHAFVRPCRLLRARRLRRGAAASRRSALPMEAGAGRSRRWSRRSARFVFGWFCVRLSGVYLAMLTLAFAQIIWSIVFQWDALTGGSNGLTGVWPSRVAGATSRRTTCSRSCASPAAACWSRMLFAPFGYALRAGRDSPLRADAIGIDVKRMQWVAFVIAGTVAGAGRLRCSRFPRAASRRRRSASASRSTAW